MRTYNLEVTFNHPGDEKMSEIFLRLSPGWFKYSHIHTFIPPHKVSFIFERLTIEGVENYKSLFRSFNVEKGNFTIIEVVG